MIGRSSDGDPPDGGDGAPERPTHPPPPSYSALRQSTMAPPLDDGDQDDEDAGAPIVVDEQPAEYDDETDARVPERVLNDNDLEWLAIGPDHKALLDAIDGKRNIAAVAELAGLDGDRTRALLAWLLRRGVVRMKPTTIE